jgi:hypothetical protein
VNPIDEYVIAQSDLNDKKLKFFQAFDYYPSPHDMHSVVMDYREKQWWFWREGQKHFAKVFATYTYSGLGEVIKRQDGLVLMMIRSPYNTDSTEKTFWILNESKRAKHPADEGVSLDFKF